MARVRTTTPSRKSPVAAPVPPPVDLLVGSWIASFNLDFPQRFELPFPIWLLDKPPTGLVWKPTVFLACFVFNADGTFTQAQYRNMHGEPDYKDRSGTYAMRWISDVAGGDISIGNLVMIFLMRNRDELHFIIDGEDRPVPVAQGTMYRAEITR